MKWNRNVTRAAVVAAACVWALQSAAQAVTITGWDFQNYGPTPPTVPPYINSPTPDLGVVGIGTATSLGMTNSYTYSTTPTPTVGSVTADDILNTPGSSTDTTPGGTSTTDLSWRVRGPGNKVTGVPGTGNGWNLAAPQFTQGAEFAVPTSGFTGIIVSYDWFTTNQGIADQVAQYTTDGTTWTSVPTSASVNPAGPNYYMVATPNAFNNLITIDFGALGITSVENNPNFAVRMVSVYDPNYTGAGAPTYTGASGGVYNNNSGNWRFDNVIVSGTAIPTPEPSTIALAVFGLIGLGFHAARRRYFA